MNNKEIIKEYKEAENMYGETYDSYYMGIMVGIKCAITSLGIVIEGINDFEK